MVTVKGDLERAIAMAEASKGHYLLFSTESEDQKAKTVFQDMAQDMERHIKILESRKEYLIQNNQLNADENQGGSDKKKKQQSDQESS